MSYTFAELEWLFIHAGGGPLYAPVAAAIALAESGGCPYALAGPFDIRPKQECVYRQTVSENSFGLWQINLQAHPQYDFGDQGRNLFGALANAHAAVTISSQGRSFGAWSTYTSGAYRSHLPGKVPEPVPAAEDAVLGPMLQPGSVPIGQNPKERDLTGSWAGLALELGHHLPRALKRGSYYRHLLRKAVE